MEGCPRTRRSPTLARLVTRIRRAFRGFAGAFLGRAASTFCFCSSVSCCAGGCCANRTDAQISDKGTNRYFIYEISAKLALQAVRRLLGFGGDIAVERSLRQLQRFRYWKSRQQG